MKNLIAEFKQEVKNIWTSGNNDTSRPKRKIMDIRVTEKEGQQAEVELYFDQEFYRMFGRHNTVRREVFTGDIKEACKVAREFKKLLPTFKIEFYSLEYMNSFKTEMM